MSVSEWITCHCGQHVPAYMADSHISSSGGSCVGIREELHMHTICLDCANDTHTTEYQITLRKIRHDRKVTK